MQNVQYDLEAVRRFIQKNGPATAKAYFSNPNLSPSVKKDLVKDNVIVNGNLNISLINALC